jgi:cell division septum initiation protein DivIVA
MQGDFSDSFNPHWTTGEAEEMISSLENNINTMHPDANRFKEVCRNLRKEYQDFTTKSGLSEPDEDP